MDILAAQAYLKMQQKSKNMQEERFINGVEVINTSASDSSTIKSWLMSMLIWFIVFFFISAGLSFYLNSLMDYGIGEKILYALMSGIASYYYIFYVLIARRDSVRLYTAARTGTRNTRNGR